MSQKPNFLRGRRGIRTRRGRSRQIYSLAHLTALIPFQKLSDNFTINTQLFEE